MRILMMLLLSATVALAACTSAEDAATPIEPTAPSESAAPIVSAVSGNGTTAPSDPAPTEPVAPATPATPDEPDNAISGSIDWTDSSQSATLAPGTTIAKCEGDAPFLCVERDGATIGTLEMLRYPVASFDLIDPASALETNIRTMSADFLAAIGDDRAATCGADYRFEPLEFESFSFGDQPAFHYGYRGTMADGAASELNLQYATIVGDDIVLVTAIAYDAGGCPGRDDLPNFDSATLAELSDELETVLRQTPIP